MGGGWEKRSPGGWLNGRIGGLPDQAGSDRGTFRGHRPAGIQPQIRSTKSEIRNQISFGFRISDFGFQQGPARPSRRAESLRERFGGAAQNVPGFQDLYAGPTCRSS